jgi:hypothetical protein
MQYGTHIKTFAQKMMTTYRLPIQIEHTLPNLVLVDCRKLSTGSHIPERGFEGRSMAIDFRLRKWGPSIKIEVNKSMHSWYAC